MAPLRALRQRAFIGVLVGALGLYGCTPLDTNDPTLTPQQRQLRVEAQRFYQTTAVGIVAGCAAGAILLALLSSGKNRGANAAIGCAGGAALGGAAGYYVATQNKQYANTEAALNAKIDAAQKEADNFKAIAETSNTVKEQNLERIAELKERLHAGQLTAEQYKDQTKSILQDIEILKKASRENGKVVGEMRADANALRSRGEDAQGLEDTSSQMEEAQQRIDANMEEMVKALSVS